MKIIVILFFFGSILLAQSVDFYKEDITFKLNKNKFCVDGIYYFRNNTDKIQKDLIYFPVKSICPNSEADSVNVFNLSKMLSVKISKKSANGFFFILEVDAGDSAHYQIKYQQDICCDSVLYILKSTQRWGKPLSSGIYKLLAHKSIKVNYFSYEPDKEYNIDDFYIYSWKKKDFFPNQDIVFKFDNN